MLRKPRQQKQLGPETIIRYMDEVLTLDKEAPEYPFVYHHGAPPDLAGLRLSDLISLMSVLGMNDPGLVRSYLERSFGSTQIDRQWSYLEGLLEKAWNYYEDFILPSRQVAVLEPEQWGLVDEFAELINRETDADGIQNGVFAIARAHGLPPSEYFKLLYRVLLGTDSGPRMGTFVRLVGKEKVMEIIRAVRGGS